MNAVRSARSRRTSAWVGTLTGVVVLAAAPVVTTAIGVGPAGAVARSAGTQRVFVSPQGHAGAAGTRHDPLASVDEAVGRLTHGGVVLLRGGTYAQRVMLRGVHQRDDPPVPARARHPRRWPIDASPDRSAMVTIVNSSRVTVSGLDIRNYDTTSKSAMPIGIYVHGASSHVTLRHNHVHSMGNYNGTLGSFDINAHGIAVYGDRARHPIVDVTISHNEVDHLALGASESVVVNGNVNHWRITHNRIHDNNNIGIDAIGFEPTLSGPARYSRANRARNGVIADNVITNIISRGQPGVLRGRRLVQLRRRHLHRRGHGDPGRAQPGPGQ